MKFLVYYFLAIAIVLLVIAFYDPLTLYVEVAFDLINSVFINLIEYYGKS